MSLTNDQITAQNFKDFYDAIRPYLNGQVPTFANAFNKSDLYSTDEKIVGCWIDGKPLYQKTVTLSNITIPKNGNYQGNISDYFSDVETVVDYICIGSGGGKTPNYMATSELVNYSVGFTIDKPNDHFLFTRGNSSVATDTFYLTMKYTKTTDTAIKVGDGNDYSTDEQIVGTWIDGKPLYQKTIVDTTGTTAGTGKNISIGSTCEIHDVKGYIVYNQNHCIPVNSYDGATNDHYILVDWGLNGLGGLRVVVSKLFVSKPIILTVQYTKTTD